MTEITFNYNPYTKEKMFFINGQSTSEFNKFFDTDKELMEFPDFFDRLYDKLNDHFALIFTGIERDYDFLEDSLRTVSCRNRVELRKGKVIKVADSIGQLKELFEKMQRESPFEDLRGLEIRNNFNRVLNNQFEMAVVATMSSGKSTLINAMLGRALLPARNEATTATLAKIHDCDGMVGFEGKSYDAEHRELASCTPLTLENMNLLNDNKNTALIEIKGDIIGIESKNLQLVLTDTPGPNNSRTSAHKEHTYRILKDDYKPMVLYVLNVTQPESNDDAQLLRDVAAEMRKGNRQSSDRFLFIVNKMSQFDPSESHDKDVGKKLGDVKRYLEGFGIKNPRIFPCDARLAKMIRQLQSGDVLTSKEKRDLNADCGFFIEETQMHLHEYASISDSVRKSLSDMIEKAKAEEDEYSEVLVYSGVPAVELTISEYLEKYALPTKITEAISCFYTRLESLEIESKAIEKLNKDKAEMDKLAEQLKVILGILEKGDKAGQLKQRIEKISVEEEIAERWEECNDEFQKRLNQLEDWKIKVALEDAPKHANALSSQMSDLTMKFGVDLQNIIDQIVKQEALTLKQEYDNYLKELIGGDFDHDIDPAEIVGSLASVTVDDFIDFDQYSSREKVGEHYVENTDKKWYKFWTWLQPDGYWIDDYADFVYFEDIVNQEILPQIEDFVDETEKLYLQEVKKQIRQLKTHFIEYFDELDMLLKEKIRDREACLSDQGRLEKEIETSTRNLAWLAGIKKELSEVLSV